MNVVFHLFGDSDVFEDTGKLVLTLDGDKCSQLVNRIEIAESVYRHDKAIAKVCFDDWDVSYVSSAIEDAAAEVKEDFEISRDGYVELPDVVDIDEYKDEGPRVAVSYFSVWPSIKACEWDGIHKYSDDVLCSTSLTFEELRRLCNRPEPVAAE